MIDTKKVAIVVGISGMDAESMTHFLLQKDYTVVGTYRRNTLFDKQEIINRFSNNPNLDVVYCDITDGASVNKLFTQTLWKHSRIDEIYLLAAQSHVGDSFNSAETTVITNGMSAYHFLENIRNMTPTTRLYFAATSELLGGDAKRCPFDELSEFECRSPYSIGKELGVRWIKYYQQTYGIFGCYGILFNHSNCNRGKDFYIRKVTNSAARIALGKQKELKLGNINFWRDEHWSDFGMEAAWKMMQLPEPEVFLICRGKCFHGEEFLDRAFGYFNLDWKKYVKFDAGLLRKNEVVKLVGTPKKAMEKLGWNPERMPFEDHMQLMCDYDYKLEKGESPSRPNVFKLYI